MIKHIKLLRLFFRGKVHAKEFKKLLYRITKSDCEALREISDEYSHKIYRVGVIYCKDVDYANDIVNLVLTAIWQNAEKYRSKNIRNPDNWIFEMAKNKAFDYLRKACNQKGKHLEYNNITEKEVVDYLSVDNNISEIEFESIIAPLTENEKTIVRKKILYCYTHNEIAEELDLPLGTVLWRYNNAIKKLRKYFD